MKTPAVELYLLVLLPLVVHLLHGAFAQQTQAEVRDGQVAGDRDNASTAQTAIIVTAVLCAIGGILFCGAIFFCIYQKCCVEECII